MTTIATLRFFQEDTAPVEPSRERELAFDQIRKAAFPDNTEDDSGETAQLLAHWGLP